MKITSFKICPFVQPITTLLEAKGLECELKFIHLNNKPQWFLDRSPHGQVPVLVTDNDNDNDTALFESDAIAEYLEDAYPPLQPHLSVEEKALNRAWSYLASKNYLVQCYAQRSTDADMLKNRNQKLGRAFDRIKKPLTAAPFFNGNTIGMVNIAWLPLLHHAAIIEHKSGYVFIANRPG